MFGTTWVSESTSSTANFTSNTDQVFSMKLLSKWMGYKYKIHIRF